MIIFSSRRLGTSGSNSGRSPSKASRLRCCRPPSTAKTRRFRCTRRCKPIGPKQASTASRLDGHVFLEPGTYYFKVKEESTGLGGRYTLKVTTSSQNQAVQDRCTRFVSLLGEPLSGCQWHLKNTGAVHSGGADQDLNVEPAWEITKGRGVTGRGQRHGVSCRPSRPDRRRPDGT